MDFIKIVLGVLIFLAVVVLIWWVTNPLIAAISMVGFILSLFLIQAGLFRS